MSFFTRFEVRLTELRSWTRIITKSTDRMTEAVRHLLATDIPGWAAQYAMLRQSIVDGKLSELRASCHATQIPTTNALLHQDLTDSLSSFDQPAIWEAQPTQFVMGDDAFDQDAFRFE